MFEPFQRFLIRWTANETVETVSEIREPLITRLKPGENEMENPSVGILKFK